MYFNKSSKVAPAWAVIKLFSGSNSKELNVEHLLQLLIYTILARDRNYEIDYITIFNPLLGIVHWCDISVWNKGNELLEYLYNKI